MTGHLHINHAERMLGKLFGDWQRNMQTMLENHNRDIRDRLAKIEREIDKKSDKEQVEIMFQNTHRELKRQEEDINKIFASLNDKMGVATMWKIVGLVMALGSAFGGIIGFGISLIAK